MRYNYEKPKMYIPLYGKTYICNHPLYSKGTLFEDHGIGFVVIQHRYNFVTKRAWWGEIDPWIANDIYLNSKFPGYFAENAAKPSKDGLYPTFDVRKIMWALRMKPLQKDIWESFS